MLTVGQRQCWWGKWLGLGGMRHSWDCFRIWALPLPCKAGESEEHSLGHLAEGLGLELFSEVCLHWQWSQAKGFGDRCLVPFPIVLSPKILGDFLESWTWFIQMMTVRIPGISGVFPQPSVKPSNIQHFGETFNLEYALSDLSVFLDLKACIHN